MWEPDFEAYRNKMTISLVLLHHFLIFILSTVSPTMFNVWITLLNEIPLCTLAANLYFYHKFDVSNADMFLGSGALCITAVYPLVLFEF